MNLLTKTYTSVAWLLPTHLSAIFFLYLSSFTHQHPNKRKKIIFYFILLAHLVSLPVISNQKWTNEALGDKKGHPPKHDLKLENALLAIIKAYWVTGIKCNEPMCALMVHSSWS